MTSRRAKRWRLSPVVSLVGLLVSVLTEGAAARQDIGQFQQDDLAAVVHSFPAGQGGGYAPIPIDLQNRGPDAHIVVRFRADLESSIVVRKQFMMPQNSEQKLQLLVPVLANSFHGDLEFYRNGKHLDKMQANVRVSGSNGSSYGGPSGTLHVAPYVVEVSDTVPDYSKLLKFLEDHHFSTYWFQPRIEPASAPTNWLGYSALDVVTIQLAELEKLDVDRQKALLDWVRCGGNLIVHSTGEAGAGSSELDELFELERAAGASGWLSLADLYSGTPRILPAQATQYSSRAEGKRENEDLSIRFVMLGRLLAISESPYAWSSEKWGDIFNAIGENNLDWSDRYGITPASKSDNFLEFLVPGIRRIPAWGFITLITIFVVLIGPVSLFVLRRRNQLTQLLWTVPTISLITCALLFTYSTFSNGFGTKSRLRSLTVLDQRNQTAVSYSRLALFTPAGSTKLRFQASTSVTPIWAEVGIFGSGSVDWSELQELSGGFHRANKQSQLQLLQPRTERGHLEFGKVADAKLPVTNGLEWALKRLLVCGPDGQLYWCEELAAGAQAMLSPAQAEDLEKIPQAIEAQVLRSPADGLEPPDFGGYRSYYSSASTPSVNIRMGKMERYISQFRSNKASALLPPQSYIAIVSEAPSLDLGIERHSLKEQLNILVGFY